MIKFITSNYDKECGMSYVKIATELGIFEGHAFLNTDEDMDYESEFLGCEIAEMRAVKDYYIKKRRNARHETLVLDELIRKLRSADSTWNETVLGKVVLEKWQNNKKEKEKYTAIIHNIRDSIEAKLDGHIELVDKIAKRNKDKN